MSRRPARHSLCVACGAYLVGSFPSMISRRTMRAPSIDRIILRSNFTLFLEYENLSDHFNVKLAVSRCFAIHDRRSKWSACHPGLFRPGLLLRPSTPLNNPLHAPSTGHCSLPHSSTSRVSSLFILLPFSASFPALLSLAPCLPRTMANTTRARPLLRLWVKPGPACPLVLSCLANSAASSVGLTRALLSRLPHRNTKTPLVR